MTRLERRVPQEVRDELDALLATRPNGLTSIPKIHAHLRLKERFGVSRATLRAYAASRRRPRAADSPKDATRVTPSGEPENVLPADVRRTIDEAITRQPEGSATFREIYEKFKLQATYGIDRAAFDRYAARVAWVGRLSYVGQIARLICGQLTADQEAQVQRAAQLVIVGRIIEALIRDDGELSTAELGKLVSMYVSQRKLGEPAAGGAKKRKAGPIADRKRPLPEGFREAIQQIYGVSLGSGENRVPGESGDERSKMKDER